jgi:branched-chain amino acid transport system permease protein
MKNLRGWRLWVFVAAVAGACCVPFLVANDYQMQVVFRIALFAALGLAWDLVGGYAGQLSLGHAAFFGLGAYSLALLTERGVPLWLAVFVGALIATAFAAVIGRIMFRLRGPYFTLASIAAAEVLRLLATNLEITKGAIGVATPALFTGHYFWRWFYFSAVVLAVLTFLVNAWVSQSRFGYYLMAIREDEDTASAVGIDTASYKNRSLLISAFVTALGGTLYASAFQFIIPDNVFTIDISLQVAIITMLGGAGTLLGPIVGAILLLSASEIFKNQFKESHLLIYGILIVVVVLFLPEGIMGGFKQLANRLRPQKKAATVRA